MGHIRRTMPRVNVFPITGGTPGSVLFAGSDGLISQDNAAFYWDETNDILKATNAQFKGRPWFDVRSYGAAGDGTTDDTTAIQAAITAAVAASKAIVFLPSGTYRITASLTITSATNLRITGPGKISMASTASYAFQLVGTNSFLEIDTLTISGTGVIADAQTGIGNASADGLQIISDVRFHDLNISDVCVGISLNADLGGSYKRAIVRGCIFSNIVGINSSVGYGIQMAGVSCVLIEGNITRTVQRHDIYLAHGDNVTIAKNISIDHRSGVSDGSYRCAIVCVRNSTSLRIVDNIVRDFYDGALEISGQTSNPYTITDVIVQGNSFHNPKNAVAPVLIGEQATQTSVTQRDIQILNNVIFIDTSLMTAIFGIQLFFGNGIRIHGNSIRLTGLNGTAHGCIKIGNSTYVSSSSYFADIDVSSNYFLLEGSNVASAQPVRIDSFVCGANGVTCQIRRNFWSGAIGAYTRITLEATNSNPVLVYDTMTGKAVGKYVAGDLTPSVAGIDVLDISNSSSKTITQFDDAEEGQELVCFFRDANTTISNSNIYTGSGGGSITSANRLCVTFVYIGNAWREKCRSQD